MISIVIIVPSNSRLVHKGSVCDASPPFCAAYSARGFVSVEVRVSVRVETFAARQSGTLRVACRPWGQASRPAACRLSPPFSLPESEPNGLLFKPAASNCARLI